MHAKVALQNPLYLHVSDFLHHDKILLERLTEKSTQYHLPNVGTCIMVHILRNMIIMELIFPVPVIHKKVSIIIIKMVGVPDEEHQLTL